MSFLYWIFIHVTLSLKEVNQMFPTRLHDVAAIVLMEFFLRKNPSQFFAEQFLLLATGILAIIALVLSLSNQYFCRNNYDFPIKRTLN